MYTPEVVARIEQLRAIAQIRKLTNEECAESIRLIRQDRVSASHSSAAARKKRTENTPSADGSTLLQRLAAAVQAAEAKATAPEEP